MNRFGILIILHLASVISLVHAQEDSLKKARSEIFNTNQILKESQQTINQLDDQRAELTNEYQMLLKEIENYQIYNRQLKEIVNSQQEEMNRLHKDIGSIDETGLKIMPFMEKMIDGLEKFLESDLPFLPEERTERVRKLRANMTRADLSLAAKYRQILESYQIEMDYGKTMESYEGELDGKKVTFLKIGRIGFYCLRFDLSSFTIWNQEEQQWQFTDDEELLYSIKKAVRIARKQTAPEFFLAAVKQAEERK